MKIEIDNAAGNILKEENNQTPGKHLQEKGRMPVAFVEQTDDIEGQTTTQNHGKVGETPEQNFKIIIDHSAETD